MTRNKDVKVYLGKENDEDTQLCVVLLAAIAGILGKEKGEALRYLIIKEAMKLHIDIDALMEARREAEEHER